jgi:hypothetical protein
MGDGARPMYVFVFLAASLAVLFADAPAVGSWEQSASARARSIRSGGGTTARGHGAWPSGASPWRCSCRGSSPASGPSAAVGAGGVATQIRSTHGGHPAAAAANPATRLFVASVPTVVLALHDPRHVPGAWLDNSRSLTGVRAVQQPARGLSRRYRVNANTSDRWRSESSPAVPRRVPGRRTHRARLQQHYTFGPLTQPWLPLARAGVGRRRRQQTHFDPETALVT